MASIREIIQYLETWVPLSWQESYDNAGLQAGNPDQPLRSGLICLDVRPEVMDEAIATGANFILSHHPVLFHPLRCVSGRNLAEQTVIKAIEHNIVIYSMHTNLDNAPDGVNAALARRLRLNHLEFLRPVQPNPASIGSGMIGELASPLSEEEALCFVKERLALPVLRHSKRLGGTIRRIALCGGAGAFLIPDAIARNADMFVVGEAHYHDFIDYENRMLLLEVGHYESEHWIKYDLLAKLNEKFSTFAVSKCEESTYNYL